MTIDSVDLLLEIAKLMKLRNENIHKIRAFERAAQSLRNCEDLADRAKNGTLKEIPGVGKGIADVLEEFLLKGQSTVRDQLLQVLPEGLMELVQIPGLGAKKASLLIEKLGIHSIGELEYACQENRLLQLKGFGPKAQEKILEAIQFQNSSKGFFRYVDAMPHVDRFLNFFAEVFPEIRISETGELRRKREVLKQFEFLVENKTGKNGVSQIQKALDDFLNRQVIALPIELHFCTPEKFGYKLAKTTGSPEHWEALGAPSPFGAFTEEQFYAQLELPWIPPETRETGEEVRLAKTGDLAHLLHWRGLKGIFHNHTHYSDGVATIEEMVAEAEKLGYEYIGISDHSQSASYAGGLKQEDLLEQEKEIHEVREKYPGIRVLWGIESDILIDGSLDYESKILRKFDFVIASIHTRFQMDRQAMTERVIKAIQNPCTRFFAHPTGRLLLGRKGYELEMEGVIEEAARCGVAIEFNSNPARMDIDWRWGPCLRKNQTVTAVNPDAHDLEGIKNVQFGITMARKALIPAQQIINSKPIDEVEKWLKRC